MKFKILNFFALVLMFFSSVFMVVGHGDEVESSIDWLSPTLYLKASVVLLVALTIYIMIGNRDFVMEHKTLVFRSIIAVVMVPTLYLAGHTIHENIISETGGPIHWHADYQVWVCGERIDLVDPTGLKNKIGTPLFHEHNDDRVHVEGNVKKISDVTLGKYFEVIGGKLQDGNLVYPANTGEKIDVTSGELCGDEVATLKVYVNGKMIDDYYNYMYYPHSYVPPGDCIIIKFDSDESTTTDVMCDSWDVQGWNYEGYKRPAVTIGDYHWEGTE